MPRLNGRGMACMGVGDGPGSVDGVVFVTPGGCAQWFDDDHVIYQTVREGRVVLETFDVQTGQYTVLQGSTGCNELAAGAGRFLAFLAGRGLYGDIVLPAGGVSLTSTDGRGAIGADGTLAYIPVRAGGPPTVLLARDGTRSEIMVPAYGLQVLGRGQAIWNGGWFGMERPTLLPGAINVRVVDVNGLRWYVYWTNSLGLVAHPHGSFVGHVLCAAPETAFHHDAVGVGGRLVVAYSRGPGELPTELVRIEYAQLLPLVDLARPVVDPIVRIGRPLWVGFFAFGPDRTTAPLPGNCRILVPELAVVSPTGEVIAHYVASEGAGAQDLDNLDVAIAAARAVNPGIPVVAYWTRGAQAVRPPRGADIVGVEAYRLKAETIEAFEARVRAAVRRVPAAAIIAQSYTSNADQHPDLAALVPVYARIARDCSTVVAVLGFSGIGRATGLQDHPEAQPLWAELAAGVPSAPAVPVRPQPKPPTPKPPAPTPTPKPQPKPVYAYGDVLMQFSIMADPLKRLLVVKEVRQVPGSSDSVLILPDDRVFSCQPDGSAGDRDPGADGGYERCRISGNVATFKPVDGKYFTFGFVAVAGL